MTKPSFSISSKGEMKEVRRHTHRYWALQYSEGVNLGQEWARWMELKSRQIAKLKIDDSIKYVLDVIDNKVVHSTMSLRDLEMMNKRRWPLREKMVEVLEERSKAKRSRRTMARWEKETNE